MHYMYILYSHSKDKYYVGESEDVNDFKFIIRDD